MAVLFRGTDRRLALFFGAPKPNPSAVTCRERRMEPDFPQRSSAFLGLIRFRRRGLRLRRSEYPALLSSHTRLRAGPFTWCRLPADAILCDQRDAQRDRVLCDVEQEAQRRYLRALLDDVAQGSLEQSLLDGPGSVCVRHLSRVFVLAGERLPLKLIDAAREAYTDLEADLGRYVRHSDYRFRNEPWGKERDSWKRVVIRMFGERRV